MAYCRWSLGMSSRVWPPIGTPPGLGVASASRKNVSSTGSGAPPAILRINGHVDMEPEVLAPASLSGANWRWTWLRRTMPVELDLARDLALGALGGLLLVRRDPAAVEQHDRAVVGAQRRHDLHADLVLAGCARRDRIPCRAGSCPDPVTRPYSRRSGSPFRSSSSGIGAAAWLAAMRSRMSRFHSRRSICQTPSASENRKIGSE